MKQPKVKILVIGGGPAGLMAAGQAARRGLAVTLLEKMEAPASKLKLTGNGRCNITNSEELEKFIGHYGRNGKFLLTAYSKFFSGELLRFFNKLGIDFFEDKRGRVYPSSNSADEVAGALLKWVSDQGVVVKKNSAVKKIIAVKNRVAGIQIADGKNVIPADIVILATGGASYPATGSTGDGYHLAESLGHRIIRPIPALVPLLVKSRYVSKLKGISLESIMASVFVDGKKANSAEGDLLFTHFGLSGPLILTLSKTCVIALEAGTVPSITLDLAPEYAREKFDKILQRRFEKHGRSQVSSIISEFVPHKMGSVLLSEHKIQPEKKCGEITADERRLILEFVKELSFEIRGHRSFAQAMVTAGGVNLKEINPQTMESRLIRSLYFAGEVIDIDGDTGGYNLQAAFSTGWLAGRMCALS